MRFSVAVALAILGYALMYVGLSNSQNGGQGPGLGEALGLDIPGLPGAMISKGKKLSGTDLPAQSSPTFLQV